MRELDTAGKNPWPTIIGACATLGSLLAINHVAADMHLRVWGSFEMLSSASELALWLALFISAAVGGLASLTWGSQLRSGIGVALGAASFFLTSIIRGYAFLSTGADAFTSAFGAGVMQIAAWWLISSVWVVAGFLLALGVAHLLQRKCYRGLSALLTFAMGILILYSTYLPLELAEKRHWDFTARSIEKLHDRLEAQQLQGPSRLLAPRENKCAGGSSAQPESK